MKYSDAMIYNRPYADSPVASQIIAKTMDKVGSLRPCLDEISLDPLTGR